MAIKRLSAGDIIEARCTKCREIMNHTIVAMVGERVVRVECNTCHGTHNYHGKPEAKAPAAASARKTPAAPRAPRKDPGAADREEWASLRPTMAEERALPYEMTGKYRTKSLVSHPIFGLGVVQLVMPNKIEVLFRDGKKLLRSA